MSKRHLSELNIGTKFITSVLHKAGGDKTIQICSEVSFTKGWIAVSQKLYFVQDENRNFSEAFVNRALNPPIVAEGS